MLMRNMPILNSACPYLILPGMCNAASEAEIKSKKTIL